MFFSDKLSIGASCLKRKIWGTRTPILVSLSVTGRCNLHCPYCYINVYNRKPEEPTLADLCRFADEFYDLGTRIFFLQGGEPLLRKDLPELIRHIKRRPCYVSVSTNGSMTETIANLKGLVDHLELSLDGAKELNDKTRGPGMFDKVMKSAKVAADHGIKFHFHSVLNVHNAGEENIRYMAALSREHNTYFTSCFASTSGYDNTSEFNAQVKDDQQHEVYKMLLRLKAEGLPIGSTPMALQHALDWPIPYDRIGFADNLPAGYRDRCVHGRLTAWLDHEGWLYPCTLAFGRTDFRFNVKEYGVKGAWDKLACLTCVDCGVASDIPYLFGLKIRSLLTAALKY